MSIEGCLEMHPTIMLLFLGRIISIKIDSSCFALQISRSGQIL